MSKEFGEQLDREYKEYKDWRNRPLEPLEPEPNVSTPQEWEDYLKKRNAARRFAIDNDLRGTFATLQRRRIKIPKART